MLLESLYVHVPFCKKACHYCNFHFSTSLKTQTSLLTALGVELGLWNEQYSVNQWNSVYFGGGSPSILDDSLLTFLHKNIIKMAPLALNAEYTLEANPDDVTLEKAMFWADLGINRISLGIQSFLDRDLSFMNRAHNSQQASHAIKILKETNFRNFNIDLIYGIPGQGLNEWEANLLLAIQSQATHISAYALTIEEKTVFGRKLQKNQIQESPEELIDEQYQLMCEILKQSGYEHYEISNFALQGKRAIHNSSYWKGQAYLGIGPSANSFDGSKRWWNISNNPEYIKNVNKNERWFDSETLSPENIFNEKLMLGLRTSTGIEMAFLNYFNSKEKKILNKLINKGWIEMDDDYFRIAEKHWLLTDEILKQLMR